MSDLALRQRSSTELVDATFQVYRRDPLPFILAGAVVYVPWLLIRLLFGFGLGEPGENLFQLFAAAAGIMLVYAVASAATSLLTRDIYFNRPADLAGAFKATLPRIPTIIAATVLAFVAYFLSLMLLVLPFFYVLAQLFAMRQSIMLEGTSVGGAFTRSTALSRGVKGHVLLTLLLVVALTLAVNMGAGLLALMIPSLIVQNVLTTIVTTLIFPLFAITETLLYYDVRIRKEGFDVEYLASQNSGEPQTPVTAQ